MTTKKQQILDRLEKAYAMELETAINYLAESINLDGVRAEEIKKALAADIQGEIGHAQRIGNRIKQLGGTVPGSLNLNFDQKPMQPSNDSTDVVSVIKGVIGTEQDAIRNYNALIKICEGEDYVTQSLCIETLAEEEGHLTMFNGFLKEYERK
ncbi:MAG TPA: ferritin-like domain-containing protein [Acidobacteriota bacterium]|nr:ferritin-like domain-containing protein [Acidobacteriota bacterium]